MPVKLGTVSLYNQLKTPVNVCFEELSNITIVIRKAQENFFITLMKDTAKGLKVRMEFI
jgi:hypothetical protein